MAIVVNIDMMLAKRKMTLTELSEKVGLTIQNMSNLKSGKGRAIRFTTLNSICEALECRPGDVLDYVTDEEYKKLYRL
jgi:putative transcriptional regulator